MTYMNQFSCGDNSFDWKLGKDGNSIPPITIDKPTLFSEYKWFGWMENLFDWSKWWFYENDLIKYGGLAEWAVVNYPDECSRGEIENLPGHPTSITNKNFVDEVLIKLLDEML